MEPPAGGAPEAPAELDDLEAVRARIRDALAGVERVVAVMSGKGGVGKSVVAVNLALALAARGQRVGILDADLQGPSVGAMLGLGGQPVRVVGERLRPVPGPGGLAVQGMAFFLQGAEPLDWEGAEGEGSLLRSAMEAVALRDLIGRTDWGELETLVVDLAPGADRLPAFAQLVPSLSGALAVTLPTEVALLAVERSVRRAHAARIPMLGLVENLGSAVCAACGAEGPLFREGDVEGMAETVDLEILARIPFDPHLAAAADAGRPFVGSAESEGSPAGRAFAALATRLTVAAPARDEARP